MDPSSLPPPLDLPLPPPAPPSVLPPPPPTAATIANPSPPALNNSNHPTYAEMIYAAITALKEKDGSSKRAIAKYIEKAYTNLQPTHSALLTHNLKRLKNSGFLVMVKKSYKLPRSDATLPSNEVLNNSNPTPTTTAAAVSTAHGPKPGRGRGRPRKTSVGSVLVTEKPKRGPGRPRKSDGPVQRGPKKRRPGRPRKPKTVKGRPVQVPVQAQDQLNPETVSYGTSDSNVLVPVTVPGVTRPRGRPRKVGTSADAGGNQRGRLPKKLKNGTGSGRPVGRPKKSISSTLTEAAEAQAQTFADLKRKLELFQSKVKQAVGVLKPQLNHESQISTVAAIQDLEGLASMDINAPMRLDTQPPLVQS